MRIPGVVTAAILTTNKCSAACQECCFQCTPKNNNRVTLHQMKVFVDNLLTDFPEVKSLVFTGGECFLLKQDLFDIITYASEKGLGTRCITNGYWAKSKEQAKKILSKLKKCGLTEINFSTGDNHQEWVPFQNIVNATVCAVNMEMPVVISVENHSSAAFKVADVYNHPEIMDMMDEDVEHGLFNVMNTIWIPFQKDTEYSYNFKAEKEDKSIKKNIKGCDSILEYIGLDPTNQVISCCGLTLSYIDSMKLGELDDDNLFSLYKKQFDDFLKIWLWVDGPEFIYNYILKEVPAVERNDKLIHPCQFCAEVYNNPRIKEKLQALNEDLMFEVLNRYHVKLKTIARSKMRGEKVI
ncbi:radical SAM protein [Candidatus Enterococcus clewellii]|uniref:Radical SAM core domain-containing protein n=1 Tax=Candidatus Enterococcus clewellii TaxID=1834193 RepID=A0AAQ3Y0U1_9ENTE